MGSGGAAIVSSTAPLIVTEVVSLSDSAGNILTESATGDSTVVSNFILPVDTTGALGMRLAIFSPGTSPASIAFQLMDSTGAPVEQTSTTLAANGSVARWVIGDLYSDIASGFQGTLVVSSNSPLRPVALRQNGAAPSLALIPVTAASSSKTRYFVPQVADGAFGSAMVQSTFVIYNMSANPANVTLTLTHDDGNHSLSIFRQQARPRAGVCADARRRSHGLSSNGCKGRHHNGKRSGHRRPADWSSLAFTKIRRIGQFPQRRRGNHGIRLAVVDGTGRDHFQSRCRGRDGKSQCSAGHGNGISFRSDGHSDQHSVLSTDRARRARGDFSEPDVWIKRSI